RFRMAMADLQLWKKRTSDRELNTISRRRRVGNPRRTAVASLIVSPPAFIDGKRRALFRNLNTKEEKTLDPPPQRASYPHLNRFVKPFNSTPRTREREYCSDGAPNQQVRANFKKILQVIIARKTAQKSPTRQTQLLP